MQLVYPEERNSARAVPRMDENAGGVTDPYPSAFTVRERMSAIDALTDTDGGSPGEEIKRRWRVQSKPECWSQTREICGTFYSFSETIVMKSDIYFKLHCGPKKVSNGFSLCM